LLLECQELLRKCFFALHRFAQDVVEIYFPQCPRFTTTQSYAPNVALYYFYLKFKSSFQVKRVFFLLNAAFVMAILDLSKYNKESNVRTNPQIPAVLLVVRQVRKYCLTETNF
jgi:hypothetical protein